MSVNKRQFLFLLLLFFFFTNINENTVCKLSMEIWPVIFLPERLIRSCHCTGYKSWYFIFPILSFRLTFKSRMHFVVTINALPFNLISNFLNVSTWIMSREYLTLHRCNIRSTNVLKVMNPTWHHIFNLIFILVEMETNVNDPSSSIVQSSVQLNVWWPFSPRVMVENGPSGCPLVKPLSFLSALNMTNTLTRFIISWFEIDHLNLQ